MLRGIKIRIYPDQEQKLYLAKLLGHSRKIYNLCLDFKTNAYEKDKTSVSWSDLGKYITDCKKTEEFSYLKEVHSKVLFQSIIDLNTAFTNFFRGIEKKQEVGYPKHKKKSDYNDSCRFPKDAFIGIKGNRISLIKQLKDIHFKCSRRDETWLNHNQDKIKSITLRRTPSNEYYCSVLVDFPIDLKESKTNCIGIDLGVKDFAITSDGEKFDRFKFSNLDKKLKHRQRQLSKTMKGSRRHQRKRIAVAKIHAKISNIRRTEQQKISTKLVKENNYIFLEDLNTKGILNNHKLARVVQNQGWSQFVNMLEYKANLYGGTVIKIDRFYASSKTCSCCGYKYKNLTLGIRKWTCPNCGTHHDRDINAAINILNEGIRTIGLSSPEFTHVECPTMDDKESSPLKSSGTLNRENHVKCEFL